MTWLENSKAWPWKTHQLQAPTASLFIPGGTPNSWRTAGSSCCSGGGHFCRTQWNCGQCHGCDLPLPKTAGGWGEQPRTFSSPSTFKQSPSPVGSRCSAHRISALPPTPSSRGQPWFRPCHLPQAWTITSALFKHKSKQHFPLSENCPGSLFPPLPEGQKLNSLRTERDVWA